MTEKEKKRRRAFFDMILTNLTYLAIVLFGIFVICSLMIVAGFISNAV